MSASPNTPGNAFGTPLFFKTEQELLSANLPAGVTAYAFNTGKFYNRSDSSWSGVVDSQSLGEPLQDLPDLRAVPPDSRSDKQVRLVEDSKAQYFFDSTGTGPDNGDTVIVPDVGTGAWFKIGGDGDVQLDGDNVWTGANVFVNPVVVGDVGPAVAGQALAVNSTTGAFVLPRMDTAQRDLLNSPVDGSMIYNSQVTAVQIRDSGQWITVSDAAGLLPLNNIWTGTNEFSNQVTISGLNEGLTIRQSAGVPIAAETNFPIVLQNDLGISDDVYIKMKCGTAGNAGIKFEDTGGFTSLEYLFNINQFRVRINNFAVIRAQEYGVGIGVGGTPVAGITLSCDGTLGSFKVPNMLEANRDTLPNQVNGCILYNDSTQLFNFYQNGGWVTLGTDILGSVNTWTAQNTFTGGLSATNFAATFQVTGSTGTTLPETVILAERSGTGGSSAAVEVLSGNAATSRLVFSDTDTSDAASIQFDHSFFKQMTFRVGVTTKMVMNAQGVVVGSGNQPIAGEALAVDSTTGTFMVPRMTGSERDLLVGPSDGAIIYNSSDAKFNLREGGAWVGLGQDVLGSINTWTAQNTFTGGFAATGSTAIFQKTGTVGTVANEVVILAERSETQFQGAAIQIMSGSGNLAKLIFSDSNTPESGSVTMDNSFFNQMSLRIGTTPRMILNNSGVVIGNAQPAGNQALSVISTTGTFLPPRMSNTDRTNLGVVADGSIIYNTDSLKFNFYENGAWKQLDSLLSSNNFWSNTNSFTQQFDVINSQGVRFSRGGGVTALGPEESALFRNINAGTQIKFQCQNSSQCGLQLRDASNNGGSFLYTPNSKRFDWETSGGTSSVMTLTASSLDVLTSTGARIGSNLIGAPGFGEQVSIQNSAGPAVMGLQANDTSECSMIFGSVTSAKQTEFIYDNNDGTFRFDFNGFFVAADATGMHIGDTTVNNDRLLELTSTTKTFVLNRMTTTERDLLGASAATAGALIYNSSINKLQFYNGTGWETVTSA